MIALLVLVCGNPKMQFFADCGLALPAMPLVRAFNARQPPFDVTILDRVGRLGREGFAGSLRSIAFSTTDELWRYLIHTRPQWSIHTLEYEISVGRSLLNMRITARGDELPVVVHTPRPRTRVFDFLPPELVGDPFQSGVAAASSSSAPSSSGRPASGEADASGRHPAVAAAMEDDRQSGDEMDEAVRIAGDDGEEYDDLPQDILHDLAAEMCAEFEVIAEMPDDSPEDVADHGEDLVNPEDDAAFVVVAAASVASSAAAAAAVRPSVAELVASCRIDAEGFVRTDAMPWALWSPLARITTWPSTKPMDKRNVGIRCILHGGKCSLARNRNAICDSELLGWIFAVDPPPPMTTIGEMVILRHEHMKKPVVPLLPSQPSSASGSRAS